MNSLILSFFHISSVLFTLANGQEEARCLWRTRSELTNRYWGPGKAPVRSLGVEVVQSITDCTGSCCGVEDCWGLTFWEVPEENKKFCERWGAAFWNEDIDAMKQDKVNERRWIQKLPVDFRADPSECPEGKECMLNFAALVYPHLLFERKCPMDQDPFLVEMEWVFPLDTCHTGMGFDMIATCVEPDVVEWVKYPANSGCRKKQMLIEDTLEHDKSCFVGLKALNMRVKWDGACRSKQDTPKDEPKPTPPPTDAPRPTEEPKEHTCSEPCADAIEFCNSNGFSIGDVHPVVFYECLWYQGLPFCKECVKENEGISMDLACENDCFAEMVSCLTEIHPRSFMKCTYEGAVPNSSCHECLDGECTYALYRGKSSDNEDSCLSKEGCVYDKPKDICFQSGPEDFGHSYTKFRSWCSKNKENCTLCPTGRYKAGACKVQKPDRLNCGKVEDEELCLAMGCEVKQGKKKMCGGFHKLE